MQVRCAVPQHLHHDAATGELRERAGLLVGVAAGAAILWGFSILKWGTKRGLAHRKERKELTKLNEKLERVEAERRDEHPDSGTGTTRI